MKYTLVMVKGDLPPGEGHELVKLDPLPGMAEFVQQAAGGTLCGTAPIVGSRTVLLFGKVRPEDGRLGVDALMASREDLLRDQFELSEVLPGPEGPAADTYVFMATPPAWMTDADALARSDLALWSAFYGFYRENNDQAWHIAAERAASAARRFVMPPFEDFERWAPAGGEPAAPTESPATPTAAG